MTIAPMPLGVRTAPGTTSGAGNVAGDAAGDVAGDVVAVFVLRVLKQYVLLPKL